MSTILPEDEKIRKAVRWISARRQEESPAPLMRLIEQAALQFDLSPQESSYLLNFYRDRHNEST